MVSYKGGADVARRSGGIASFVAGAMGGVAAFVIAGSACALTLEEAVQLGVSKHPRVEGAGQAVNRAQAVTREAFADYLPSVNLDAQAGYNHYTKPGTVSHARRNNDLQQGTVTVRQLLFDGLATPNRHESAKFNAEAAQFDRVGAAEEIASRVVKAYLALIEAREVLKFGEENVALHNDVVQDVAVRASSGGGSQADVYQAESRLSLAKARLVRLQGDLREAEANYIEAVGDVPGALDDVGVPRDRLPATVDDALALAVANSPQKLSAGKAVNARDKDINASEGVFYPRLDLELVSNYEDGTGARDEERADHRAVVRLRYNLYSGGADVARRRQAVALAGQARQREAEIARLLQEQVLIDFNELKVSEAEVPLLEDRVDATTEVVSAYRKQFELGRRTLLDVLDVGNELFQARTELVRGQYRVKSASYQLISTEGLLLKSLNVTVPGPSDS